MAKSPSTKAAVQTMLRTIGKPITATVVIGGRPTAVPGRPPSNKR